MLYAHDDTTLKTGAKVLFNEHVVPVLLLALVYELLYEQVFNVSLEDQQKTVSNVRKKSYNHKHGVMPTSSSDEGTSPKTFNRVRCVMLLIPSRILDNGIVRVKMIIGTLVANLPIYITGSICWVGNN